MSAPTTTLDRTTTNAPAQVAIAPADAGLLLLRLVVGVVLAGYGSQKLFGLFGGAGLVGTGEFFGSVGFTPGPFFATVGGLTELVGGLAIALGVATPLAGAAVLAVMIGAFDVARSGSQEAFYPTMNGAGGELMLAVAAAVIVLVGGGRFVLDGGRWFSAPRWRWLALGLGLLGGLAAVVYRMI